MQFLVRHRNGCYYVKALAGGKEKPSAPCLQLLDSTDKVGSTCAEGCWLDWREVEGIELVIWEGERGEFRRARWTAHFGSMKITKDVRKYAAKQGIAEEEALKKGMEEGSKEFVEKGWEVYAKA